MIDKADGWSTQSAAQLTQLLERHQGHLNRGQEMQTAFDAGLGQFKEVLGQYHTVTGHVRQIPLGAGSALLYQYGPSRVHERVQRRVAGRSDDRQVVGSRTCGSTS